MTKCGKRSKKLSNKDGERTVDHGCVDKGSSDEDGNPMEVG